MAEKTVAEQIAEAVKTATDGIKAKNRILLQETKDAKALLTKFDGVDIEALQNASDELSKLKKDKDESDGNYKKLYDTQQEQHKIDLQKITDNLQTTTDLLNTERTTNALTKSLAEQHVDPVLLDSAAIILNNNVAVNDKGIPMVGDKTVPEFVKEWAAGDVGKRFLTDVNSGGGANGPGSKADAQAAFYDPNSPSYSLTAQSKIANADPSVHKALVSAAPAKKSPDQ